MGRVQDSAWLLWKGREGQREGRGGKQGGSTFEQQWGKGFYLGSDHPVLLAGLSGVRAVGIGALHAAVALED